MEGGSYVRHKVKGSETLTMLSLKYNVPVSAIQRCNNLSPGTTEAWFRDELLIPVDPSSLPESDENESKEKEESNLLSESLVVHGLTEATQCKPSTARHLYRSNKRDFALTLKDCDWVKAMSRKHGCSEDEALGYLNCHNYPLSEESLIAMSKGHTKEKEVELKKVS